MEEEKDKVVEGQVQEPPVTPMGRARALDRYKKKFPDNTEEPTDDAMYDDYHTENEDLRGKYDQLNGINETAAEIANKDPFIAKFLSMILNGEDPYYALGKCFGDLPEQLDEESLEKLRKGQEERKAGYAKWQENSTAYLKKIEKFVADNGLTPEEATQLSNTLEALENAFANYEVPDEVFAIVWDGINSESNQNAAAEAAALAAKNNTIDEIKSGKTAKTELPPDVNSVGASGKKAIKPMPQEPEDFDKRFKAVD